jgi:hypothetical protein
MAYTKELIKEVKELYPYYPEMHRLADAGDTFLGRYLDDSSPTGIALDDVLIATSLSDLQETARNMNRKAKLYKKWCEQDPRKNYNS